jgi:hypothetical protein
VEVNGDVTFAATRDAYTKNPAKQFDIDRLRKEIEGTIAVYDGGADDEDITTVLADAARLAEWPEGPLPDVDFNVYVDPERGLIFQWQSRLELERDKKDLHETIISPFVKALHYEYYDATLKEWKVEDEPKHDDGGTAWLKPARLHLIFKFPELKSTPKTTDGPTVEPEVVINIPIKRTGATTP